MSVSFLGTCVFAQSVPQPASPPLWNGTAYNDAVESTGANLLHNIGITGQGVSAAIVNGGFYTTHEIFNGGKILNNYTGGTSDHGTHVSGIVLSMAPDARLWLDTFKNGDANNAAVFNSIADNAAANNIVAVNNSWGTMPYWQNSDELANDYPLTHAVVQRLLLNDVAVVAASGNAGVNDWVGYPEGLPSVMVVGALNRFGYITDFSNQHEKDGLFLVAPGDKIFSAKTGTNDYGTMSGTSMASPHVTGAITLLSSGARNASANEILASLYDSADRIPYDGNAIVKKEYMDEYYNPNDLSNAIQNYLTGVENVSKYTDWLAIVTPKFANDEVTADEWRILNHLATAYFQSLDNGGNTKEYFIVVMEWTGDLNVLQHTNYGFLRVDKAYMDLTHKRMDLLGNMVGRRDSGLGNVFHAYADELYAGLDYDTSQIFQRLDFYNGDSKTLTQVARQMSPRFTNAAVESSQLGIVGIHRGFGRRTEMSRLARGNFGRNFDCRDTDCKPCEPCEPCEPCDPCGQSDPCDPCNPCDPCGDLCGSSPWRVNAWIEGFGTGFDYRGSLTNADYNGSFSGTSFGYERTRDDLTLGIFGNYSNHQLNGDGRAEGEWGNVGVYGRIDNRKSFVETSLAYGFGEYDMTRNIVIPGAVFSGAGPDAPAIVLPAWFKQANSKLRTDAFSLRLAGGRDVRKINGWKIGTRAEFSLAYVNVGAYTETGAQSLNLAMDKYGSTYLEGGVGLFAGKRLRNLMATGKLMGMYGGSSGNNMNGKFAQFGSRFSTNPKSNTTAWIVPETTLSWNLSRNVVFSGSYSGRFGEKYSENTGTIALSLYR